jgi:hypothetical protein
MMRPRIRYGEVTHPGTGRRVRCMSISVPLDPITCQPLVRKPDPQEIDGRPTWQQIGFRIEHEQDPNLWVQILPFLRPAYTEVYTEDYVRERDNGDNDWPQFRGSL